MEKIVFTKSILKPKGQDGIRISVMSRHTLSDGQTPDTRIIPGTTYDEWHREFAPPAELVGAYYRGFLCWAAFVGKYLEYLRSEKMRPQVEALAKRCTEETITLMCIEKTADKCHRRLLAEELQRYQPDLKIIHN